MPKIKLDDWETMVPVHEETTVDIEHCVIHEVTQTELDELNNLQKQIAELDSRYRNLLYTIECRNHA